MFNRSESGKRVREKENESSSGLIKNMTETEASSMQQQVS